MRQQMLHCCNHLKACRLSQSVGSMQKHHLCPHSSNGQRQQPLCLGRHLQLSAHHCSNQGEIFHCLRRLCLCTVAMCKGCSTPTHKNSPNCKKSIQRLACACVEHMTGSAFESAGGRADYKKFKFSPKVSAAPALMAQLQPRTSQGTILVRLHDSVRLPTQMIPRGNVNVGLIVLNMPEYQPPLKCSCSTAQTHGAYRPSAAVVATAAVTGSWCFLSAVSIL